MPRTPSVWTSSTTVPASTSPSGSTPRKVAHRITVCGSFGRDYENLAAGSMSKAPQVRAPRSPCIFRSVSILLTPFPRKEAVTTTVLLVDDHPIVRSGLRTLLEDDGTVQIVGEAATGEEAIRLTTYLRPDVVLCDLRLGDGIDGIRTTATLRALDPAPAVLMLTTFDRDGEILGAIEAGAAGYLLKIGRASCRERESKQADKLGRQIGRG